MAQFFALPLVRIAADEVTARLPPVAFS